MSIEKNYLGRSLLLLFTFTLFINTSFLYAEGESFYLYTHSWDAASGGLSFGFYPSGYSDGFYWGRTIRHKHSSHEMLSGEFGAALFSPNLDSTYAVWLQNPFEYPDIATNSIFEGVPIYGSNSWRCWNDPNNPIDNYDTAQSVIEDEDHNQIRITIDYELVDLGEQDTNGIGGSPIVFRDSNESIVYVYSDPCVVLITYSIKNISSGTIIGLEFYQMICALGGAPDGYYSSYSSENYYDPLSNYTPYNSVHQVGNFRYDIAQWGEGDSNTQHVDWLCFSSTVPPDAFENDMFYGADGWEPDIGTYVHIKNRNLNDLLYKEYEPSYYYYDHVSGAMQWNLGDLASNETKKITLAVMFGVGPIQYEPPIPPLPNGCEDVSLTVDNAEECVYASFDEFGIDILTDYSICYSFGPACSVNDINIVATLDSYVDYNSSSPEGYYDEQTHTVTWNFGDLYDVNESNCITLTVRIAGDAAQASTLVNTVRMYQGENVVKTATDNTLVCCESSVIYVDADADDGGDGYSWDTAYNDLQTALANVTACTQQIFMAAGTYFPTDDSSETSATFQMICSYIFNGD